MKTDHLPWPESLRSAHALDTLARDLFQAQTDYYSLQMPAWEDIPQATRVAFLEEARRSLDRLQPPTSGAEVAERLFTFGVALNRSYATGLGGKVIGAINPRSEP